MSPLLQLRTQLKLKLQVRSMADKCSSRPQHTADMDKSVRDASVTVLTQETVIPDVDGLIAGVARANWSLNQSWNIALKRAVKVVVDEVG